MRNYLASSVNQNVDSQTVKKVHLWNGILCKCQREFVLFSLRIFATEIVKKIFTFYFQVITKPMSYLEHLNDSQ